LIRRHRETLALQPIGVLVAASLAGALRVTEINLHVGRKREFPVVTQLTPSIPGQCSLQLLGEMADFPTKRRNNAFRIFAADMNEHRKSRLPLDKRRNM